MNIEATVAEYGGSHPAAPHKLWELIAELQGAYDVIKHELRDHAEVQIWTCMDSDGVEDVRLKITVERPATQEELAAQMKEDMAHWMGQLKSASDRAAYCIGQIEKLESGAS